MQWLFQQAPKIRKYKRLVTELSIRQLVIATMTSSWRNETVQHVSEALRDSPHVSIIFLDASNFWVDRVTTPPQVSLFNTQPHTLQYLTSAHIKHQRGALRQSLWESCSFPTKRSRHIPNTEIHRGVGGGGQVQIGGGRNGSRCVAEFFPQ